jgi:hypothetical protein
MRISTFAAAAAFFVAVPTAAQEPAPQPPAVPAPAASTAAPAPRANDGLTGTRVRVTAPNFLSAPVTGIVTAYRQEGLAVATEGTADTVMLPLRSISRLDKFAGGSRGSTAWYRGRWGAFIGAGLGLVVGPATAKLTDREMGESAMLGGAIGLGSGFVIGALTGAAAPRERWTWTLQPWGYDSTLRP